MIKKNSNLIRIIKLRNNLISNKNRFQNKHTIQKKKSLYPDPTFFIFLNKCYQNKPILLDLPKTISTYEKIKGKHKCVGGVTFSSCYWRCHHYAGKKEMWEWHLQTRRIIFLLWLFFCSVNNVILFLKTGKIKFFCSLKSVILRTQRTRKTKITFSIKQVFSVFYFQEQKIVLENTNQTDP